MSTAPRLLMQRFPARSITGRAPRSVLDPIAGTTDLPSTPRQLDHRREQRIARALARQDPRGLEELHDLTARASYAVILSIVRDRGHAEDVQQRVYAELWRRATQFDPARGSLLTWVLTVARSRAVDHVRRRTDQPMDFDGLVAAGGSEVDRAYDDMVDRALVGEALTCLPAQERDLLRMRFWEGLTQTQIADRTGIPLGTIKSRMTAGLRRLRDELAAYEVGA